MQQATQKKQNSNIDILNNLVESCTQEVLGQIKQSIKQVENESFLCVSTQNGFTLQYGLHNTHTQSSDSHQILFNNEGEPIEHIDISNRERKDINKVEINSVLLNLNTLAQPLVNS